jgi:hypothetical protein
MSGEKCDPNVTVSRTQWNTMNNQVRQTQEALANARKERDQQVAAAQQEGRQRSEALQRQFTRDIVGLSDEMREVERRQNQAFTNALVRQGAELRHELQEQKTELTGMINAIEQRMTSRDQNQRQIAESWAREAVAFINEIDNYRHDLFTPGKLEDIRQALQDMQNDINVEAYQAAITTARNAFRDAVNLRADVIAAEIEWQRAYRVLSERAAYINSCINDAKLLEFAFGSETVSARVDFWTNGALTELENQFRPVQQIVSDPNNTSIDDLVRACTNLDDMRDRSFPNPDADGNVTGGIVNAAKERLLLSGFRADMVNDIAAAMDNEGWRVSESGYRNNDERDELHVKIEDGTGNEMIVIVAPTVNQNGALANSLSLDFFNDTQINLDYTDTIVENVRRMLHENGIVTNMRCTPNTENSQSNRQEIRNVRQTIAERA